MDDPTATARPTSGRLSSFLAARGLTLSIGAHIPTDPSLPYCKVCAQEAVALMAYLEAHPNPRGRWWERAWTDRPPECWLDLRQLNDSLLWSSDEARTVALVPLQEQILLCPEDRKDAVLRRISEHATQVLVPLAKIAAVQAEAAVFPRDPPYPEDQDQARKRWAAGRAKWKSEEAEKLAATTPIRAWLSHVASRVTEAIAAAGQDPEAVLRLTVEAWHAALDAEGVPRG